MNIILVISYAKNRFSSSFNYRHGHQFFGISNCDLFSCRVSVAHANSPGVTKENIKLSAIVNKSGL